MINDVLTHWSLNCWLVGDVTSNVISPSSYNISHIKPPWKLLHSGKPTTISRLPFRVCPRGHTLKPMTTRVRVNIFQFIEQENNKMLKTGLIVLARTPAVRALCHMCDDVVPLVPSNHIKRACNRASHLLASLLCRFLHVARGRGPARFPPGWNRQPYYKFVWRTHRHFWTEDNA